MAHSYISCYIHYVFSTKYRMKIITPKMEARLWPYMCGIARNHNMKALAIGGIEDHIHMLISLPSTISIARAIQKVPGLEIIVPFGRTPSAVANQLINYSPVGIVKAIASNIGKGRFDQRLFSQAMGRGITGSGIMYLVTQ